jgi:hypothetical protein
MVKRGEMPVQYVVEAAAVAPRQQDGGSGGGGELFSSRRDVKSRLEGVAVDRTSSVAVEM